jgi:hypothetical protein
MNAKLNRRSTNTNRSEGATMLFIDERNHPRPVLELAGFEVDGQEV